MFAIRHFTSKKENKKDHILRVVFGRRKWVDCTVPTSEHKLTFYCLHIITVVDGAAGNFSLSEWAGSSGLPSLTGASRSPSLQPLNSQAKR